MASVPARPRLSMHTRGERTESRDTQRALVEISHTAAALLSHNKIHIPTGNTSGPKTNGPPHNRGRRPSPRTGWQLMPC
eukprot:scaffold80664_cov62-Phaeocystis_antarctica.AAC.2